MSVQPNQWGQAHFGPDPTPTPASLSIAEGPWFSKPSHIRIAWRAPPDRWALSPEMPVQEAVWGLRFAFLTRSQVMAKLPAWHLF